MTVGIARLKITLDDVKPVVLRRVDVPFDIKVDRLHLTIQAAMGWTNSHLYELRAGDVGWSTPYPDADWGVGEFLDARKARLSDILEDVGDPAERDIDCAAAVYRVDDMPTTQHVEDAAV